MNRVSDNDQPAEAAGIDLRPFEDAEESTLRQFIQSLGGWEEVDLFNDYSLAWNNPSMNVCISAKTSLCEDNRMRVDNINIHQGQISEHPRIIQDISLLTSEAMEGASIWHHAPEWAQWASKLESGAWVWHEQKPHTLSVTWNDANERPQRAWVSTGRNEVSSITGRKNDVLKSAVSRTGEKILQYNLKINENQKHHL
jgi:hypothetical protein